MFRVVIVAASFPKWAKRQPNADFRSVVVAFVVVDIYSVVHMASEMFCSRLDSVSPNKPPLGEPFTSGPLQSSLFPHSSGILPVLIVWTGLTHV